MEELEARLRQFRQGHPPEGGADPRAIPALLEKLSRPALAGLELVFCTGEMRQLLAAEVLPLLAEKVLDASAPRVARARFAQLLVQGDRERWYEASDALPDEELTLSFEGNLEVVFTLCSLGMQRARPVADTLRGVPDDWWQDSAAVLEPCRRAVGVAASLVYREVFDDESLRRCWPVLSPALAEEASAEALALLDLALLRAPKAEESEAVRAARTELVARAPKLRVAAAPEGEMYLCPPDADGVWSGVVALRHGQSSSLFPFELELGGPVRLHPAGSMPTEATEALVTQTLFPERARRIPFLEGLAYLRAAAANGREGAPAPWAELTAALNAAPALPPHARGATLTAAEMKALRAEDPALWRLDSGQTGELLQALVALGEGKQGDPQRLGMTALRLQATARWLAWTGRAGQAARVAAHLWRPEEPETFPRFLDFALAWAVSESERFVAETNAAKASAKRKP